MISVCRHLHVKKECPSIFLNRTKLSRCGLKLTINNVFCYQQEMNVTNFSTCWNDGLAFCALIHYFYPEAFDFSSLDPANRRYNFTLAFDTAE